MRELSERTSSWRCARKGRVWAEVRVVANARQKSAKSRQAAVSSRSVVYFADSGAETPQIHCFLLRFWAKKSFGKIVGEEKACSAQILHYGQRLGAENRLNLDGRKPWIFVNVSSDTVIFFGVNFGRKIRLKSSRNSEVADRVGRQSFMWSLWHCSCHHHHYSHLLQESSLLSPS